MKRVDHWIFYLKLSKNLPDEYLTLDQNFKNHGKSLVPIGLKSLLECIKKGQKAHVVIVVKSYGELKYFNSKVKKMMKFIMRSERIHLYIASSFSGINDPTIMRRDYYNYVKLPVKMTTFCESVSKTIDVKENQGLVWPGGVRPKMSLVS